MVASPGNAESGNTICVGGFAINSGAWRPGPTVFDVDRPRNLQGGRSETKSLRLGLFGLDQRRMIDEHARTHGRGH